MAGEVKRRGAIRRCSAWICPRDPRRGSGPVAVCERRARPAKPASRPIRGRRPGLLHPAAAAWP